MPKPREGKAVTPRNTTILISLVVALVAGAYLLSLFQSGRLSKIDLLGQQIGEELDALSVDVNSRRPADVKIFASGLESPRAMAFGPDGTLYASIIRQGRVVALPDRNNDGVADEVIDVLAGLRQPHGLVFNNDDLYIAETNQVIKLSKPNNDGTFSARKVIISSLPFGQGHFTRTLDIGPDNKLYISIGSSCNACDEEHSWRGSIIQANLDGSDAQLYATGLRNAVGLAFHPTTEVLWASENGRDWLGDELPPDEINVIEQGQDYGWPECYGGNIVDTDFNTRGDCIGSVGPVAELPAHIAPLGMDFYSGQMFKEFEGDLFVAEHGSWNRTDPVGYRISRLSFDENNQLIKYEPFLDGWLKNGQITGRPVDIIFGSQGEMYVSDDKAGVIYRVTKK